MVNVASQGSDGDQTQLRSYGGEAGDARVARRRAALIDAALELLGQAEPAQVTVRGVCARAALTPRYFYESFVGVDDLVAATYEEVIAEIAEKAMGAFARGGENPQRVAAAVRAIVEIIDSDRRKGRLIFSDTPTSPVVAVKRAESILLFVALTARSAQEALGVDPGPEVDAAAHFQVGGLGRLLASWTEGLVDLDHDRLIAVCVGMLLPDTFSGLAPDLR